MPFPEEFKVQTSDRVCKESVTVGKHEIIVMTLRIAICLALTISTLSSLGQAQDTAPSFDEVLNRYRTATELPPRISFRAEDDVTRTTIDPGKEPSNNYSVFKMIFRKDGNRIDSQQEAFISNQAGGLRDREQMVRSVFTEGQKIQLQIGRDGAPLATWSKDSATDQINATTTGTMWGEVIEGYLEDGSGNIADLMRNGKNQIISIIHDSSSGAPLYILRAETKFGHLELSLDSSIGFLPRRMVIHRDAGSLIYGEPIPWDIVSINTVVEPFEYSELLGRRVGSGVKVTDTTNYKSGKIVEAVAVHRRTAIDIQPDFSGTDAFQLSMPEKTPVSAEKPDGLQYEWRNGKVSLAADTDVGPMIDKTLRNVEMFPREEPSNHFWWLFSSFAVFGIFFYYWFYRRSAKS